MTGPDIDPDAGWRLKGRAGPPPPPLRRVREGLAGSRVLGSLAEVTVGCMVWAHADGDLTKVRLDPCGEPAGGIVLETYVSAALEDGGELVERVHYRCANPYSSWLTQVVLTEVQVVADGCEAPSAALITRTVRRIDAHLAARKGPLDAAQAQLHRDATRLVAVLMGAAA